MKNLTLLMLIVFNLMITTFSFGVNVEQAGWNSTNTQGLCLYNLNTSANVNYWSIPRDKCVTCNSSGTVVSDGIYGNNLYLRWKNIEANASTSIIGASYGISNGWADLIVGPFTLNMPTPSFSLGNSLNMPCYTTSPISISLNSYINTLANSIDQGETITSNFEWTLPSGWQTSTGQTGTFVSTSSINVVPPSSNLAVSISVKAKANTQYSSMSTLQITRNLDNFIISCNPTILCNTTNRFTVPSGPGVSYSWQLPVGWIGTSTTNYIDVIAKGNSGTISCTMTGCNGPKSSSKSIIVDLSNPGISILGPSIVCSSGTTFTINNLPQYNSIVWTPDPNITISSGQNTASCTFSATGSGSSSVSVKLVTDCGDILIPQKTV